MEWLKKLLEAAETNEDGTLKIDSLIDAIKAEFPRHAVPKEDYNAKVEELKTANKTIKDIGDKNKGNEDLQKDLETYQADVKTLKKENETLKKTYAVKESLTKAGCTDPDYLLFKQGGIDKFTFDPDGKVVGMEELVKQYREATPHVFKPGQRTEYSPQNGDYKGKNPFAKETFNLTEQGKLLRENPAEARALAEAAGTKI